jgi:lactonase
MTTSTTARVCVRSVAAVTALAAGALAGCATGTAQAEPRDGAASAPGQVSRGGAPHDQTARRVLQVTSPHEATGMTLLEGPVFDEDGDLLLVDVTAPAGEPKVMSVDLASRTVAPVYTDDVGAYTSAQISPVDDRLYLTDYAGGRVVSITPDGEDPRTVFAGEVEGRQMRPDDLTFDADGSLFVSDSAQTTYPSGSTDGRVVRVDGGTGEATVLAEGLPNPNGISFDADGGALWVSLLDANRVDRLVLDAGHEAVATGHTAIHVDGGVAQPDSIAVDAAGNLYQGMHGTPEIRVFSPQGEHLATVRVPDADGLTSATNVAIRPGTKDAVMTVSGPAGGFLYRFRALAEGTRQSNGG